MPNSRRRRVAAGAAAITAAPAVLAALPPSPQPAQPPAPPATPIPSPVNWLNNNITVRQGAGSATGDEAELLFAGEKVIKPGMLWVSPINYPWCADTNPPSGYINFPPENSRHWAGVQWHGGWNYPDVADRPNWALIPELAPNRVFWRGSTAGMLQFIIRNYSKPSGWTDADYFWTDADRIIDLYGSQGKRFTYHWFANITGRPIVSFGSVSVPSISVARFRDALQRVAGRRTARGTAYKDVIAFWEGPNEPDSAGVTGGTWSWYNQVGSMSVMNLAEQYRIAAQSIKSIVPTALIIGPSYSAIAPHTNQAMYNFLTASAAGRDAGWGTGVGTTGADWIDCVAHHGYMPYDFTDTARFVSLYRDLKAKIAAAGAGNKPFIQSEWMAFDGAWPTARESRGESVMRQAFNHILISVTVGNSQIWTDFRYAHPFQMGNPGDPVATNHRRRWYAFIDWLVAQPITRVARLRDNRIRVTRLDGSSLTTDQI